MTDTPSRSQSSHAILIRSTLKNDSVPVSSFISIMRVKNDWPESPLGVDSQIMAVFRWDATGTTVVTMNSKLINAASSQKMTSASKPRTVCAVC